MCIETRTRAIGQSTGRILIAVLAAVSLMAAACGSDGEETQVAAEPIDDTETEAVAAAPADDESEPEPQASDPDADPDDLLGTWSGAGGVTWQIEASSIIVTGGPVDEQSYSATSTTLEMTDVSGELACPPSQVGNYEWLIVEDDLTLTLVSDECRGRGAALDGSVLTRHSAEETDTEAAAGSPAEPDPEDLLGTWTDPGGVAWEIGTDGITVIGGAVAEASYTATSTTFEWADFVCPDPGKYNWEIVDDVLTLTLISDSCEGRSTAFDGRTMTRQ